MPPFLVKCVTKPRKHSFCNAYGFVPRVERKPLSPIDSYRQHDLHVNNIASCQLPLSHHINCHVRCRVGHQINISAMSVVPHYLHSILLKEGEYVTYVTITYPVVVFTIVFYT